MTNQDTLNKAFAELNEEMLDRQTAWVLRRKEALNEYRKGKSSPRAWCYDEMFEIAGGKGWYGVITEHGEKGMMEYVVKNVAATIAKRDARIIAALDKKGVDTIPAFELTHISDGVEGVFKVAGHVVTIRTILAGGYNIQCLHQRTTVKVG